MAVRKRAARWLGYVVTLAVLGGLGTAAYHSDAGLSVRATLGQNDAKLAQSVKAFEAGDTRTAFEVLSGLVQDGHPASIEVLCQTLDLRQHHAPMGATCRAEDETNPHQRLKQLSDAAFFAQEWAILDGLLQQRREAGDVSAHFESARFEAFSRPEALDVNAIQSHLVASAQAQDPRGQYVLAILGLREISDAGAQRLVTRSFASALTQNPPIDAGHAYFELAKLMQAGLISSDLHLTEVLRRADAAGSPHAAGYLAQFYLSNPDFPVPDERDAEYWLEAAAGYDDPVAQYNLAIRLIETQRFEAEQDAVMDLLSRSAERGFAPAFTQIGAMLWQDPDLMGQSAETGRAQSVDYLTRAANMGDANALFNLGSIKLAQGDRAAGVKLLQEAQARGHALADQVLSRGTE